MNSHVNAIANRLSLRTPQRDSLEILARVCEIIDLDKSADIAQQLETIKSEFPTVEDFERDFPSMCFAIATGVGKPPSCPERQKRSPAFASNAPNLR